MSTTPQTPTAPDPEEEELTRHEEVPTALNALGQGVDMVRPASAEAAAHWDESVWRPVG